MHKNTSYRGEAGNTRSYTIYCAVRDGVSTTDDIARKTGFPRRAITAALASQVKRGYVQRMAYAHVTDVRVYAIVPERPMPMMRPADGSVARPPRRQAMTNGAMWPTDASSHFNVDFIGRIVHGPRRDVMTATEERAHRALMHGVPR